MHSDPIVDEVHRVREQLASKFNYDIAAIFADMRSRESQAGSRLTNRQQPSTSAATVNISAAAAGAANPMTATS